MAYRRRRAGTGRRRTLKRRTYKRRRYTARAKRPETKSIQFEYDSVGKNGDDFSSVGYDTATTDPVASSLCGGIPQGAGDGERVGREIFVRAVRVYFAVQPGDDANYIRFMLLQPKGRPQDTTYATLLESILSGYGASNIQWFSPIDTDNWKVYMDRTLYLRHSPLSGTSATAVPHNAFLKRTIKINQKITYTTNAASAVQPVRDLWLVAISDSGVIPSPGAVAGHVKIWYTDA